MAKPSPMHAGGEETMETLTPHQAARALATASRFDAALRQRTEGITLMVWGIATAALFVTYGFADELGATELAFGLLWIPWVLFGTLTTMALWRSAALSEAGTRLQRPRGLLLRILGLTAAFSVAFAFLQPDGPTVPLGVVGAGWAAMAAANLFGTSQRGRLLWAACGLACAAAAAALALLDAPVAVSGTVAIGLTGALPVAAGFWQSQAA